MSRTDADTEFDFASTLKGKPNQLNAEDLTSGPITVRIDRVRSGADDQPVVIHISGGHMPWKPCLTMRRLIRAVTGTTKASALVGRWVTLYCDPDVRYGKVKTGGVRMSHMSGLDRTITKALQVSKDRFQDFTVEPLRVPDQKKQSGAPTANIERVLEDAGLDLADFDEWARRQSKPTSADLTPEVRAKTAAWLVSNPAKLDEIRAVHDESPDTDTDAREPGEE